MWIATFLITCCVSQNGSRTLSGNLSIRHLRDATHERIGRVGRPPPCCPTRPPQPALPRPARELAGRTESRAVERWERRWTILRSRWSRPRVRALSLSRVAQLGVRGARQESAE